ncbi:MAG: tetratricopeptide repeat protein [Thermoanaerobaculaceae bacterium]
MGKAHLGCIFAGALLLFGCVTAREAIYLSYEEWAQELQKRGVDPSRVPNPLQVTPTMREMAAALAGPGEFRERLDRLQRALFDPQKFPFTYYTKGTFTAAEAFHRREGNCLSFTNLFVAMGRSLGIPVTTALVQRIVGSEREGDLIVVNTHVVAILESSGGVYTYDFDRSRQSKPTHLRRLDDMWITALYLNNLGADELRANHPDIALRYFQDAIKLAPEFAPAWANLGVAQRRLGLVQEALEAYGRALALAPGNPTVLTNLAALFRSLGREYEAQQAVRAANLAQASPHQLLVRGDLEMAAGKIREAKKLYRRALRSNPTFVEAMVALAKAELAEGKLEAARRWISKAEKLHPDHPQLKSLLGRGERPE